MPCYRPLAAWRAPGGGVSFSPAGGFTDRPLALGCGQCIGCRLDRSREWATRCVHETARWPTSSFLTLTYDDKHLPADGSLQRDAFPAFIKRLRKRTGAEMKYFQCGEYGELTKRPHHHAMLFGFDFAGDRVRWRTSSSGAPLYRSELLEETWGQGFCSIGAVSFETAAYVARYVTKKITGDQAAGHYAGREPEFMTCSKGIGEEWIRTYQADTYRDDFVVMRGRPMLVPRYYDKKTAELAPELVRRTELNRICRAATSKARHERTPERLKVREKVKSAALHTLAKRPL